MKPRKCHDGEKFGSLTVVSDGDMVGKERRVWCKCDCGTEKMVGLAKLKNGHTKSCGRSCTFSPNNKHGMTGTSFYHVWENIKQRTKDEANKHYGGRGISMCEEWQTFANFHEDMYESFQDGLTIERKDVNGNYCKENCIWETNTVQGHNRRKYRGNSKYYGVHWNERDGLFICSIVKFKKYMRYYSKDELTCVKAYDDASQILYGDRPNGTIESPDAVTDAVIRKLAEKGLT